MEERTMHRALSLRLKASLGAMMVAFSPKPPSDRARHLRGRHVALKTGELLAMGAAIALLLWAALQSRPHAALILPVPLLLSLALGFDVMATSERERRYRQLAASEERQALAIELVGEALWDWDVSSGELDMSPSWYAMLGYAPGEVEAGVKAWLAVAHPEDRARMAVAIERLRGGDPLAIFEQEYRALTKTGEVRWLRSRGKIIEHDEQGHARRVIGLDRDITPRKTTERMLLERGRTLERLNRMSAAISAELDRDRLAQLIVDAATELTGAAYGAFFHSATGEGVDFKLYTLAGAPTGAFAGFPPLRETALFAPTFRGEGVIRCDDVTKDPRYGGNRPYDGLPPGHLPVLSYLAAPVIARSGSVVGCILFGHPEPAVFDETAEDLVAGIAAQASIALENASLYREAQREVEERRRAEAVASAAARAKAEFLAAMSHEIRTPMTSVIGMADLLAAAALPEKEASYVQAIRTSGRHLLSIIDDVLDFSRIEAGRLELERIDFTIAQLLEEVRSLMTPQATEHGLKLTCEVADDLPPVVKGDPMRLKQMILNLVGNALKFTHEGGVVIRVGSHPDGEGRLARFRFEVQDSGIGIPADRQAELFQAFMQADRSTARRYGGSGLGLAICARLIRAMDGEIGVESEAGQGSLFWFELPLELGETASSDGGSSSGGTVILPLRVLVAEDVALNRDLIGEVLGRQGHETVFAVNGREAVELASLASFDLVLMDVQMPVMDGIEATHRIRALPPPAGTVPILALTANVMEMERQRCLAAGMDSVVTKPVAWTELFATIAAVLGQREAG